MIDSSAATTPNPSRPLALVASKLPAWVAGTRPDEHWHMREAAAKPEKWFAAACQAHPAIARQLIEEYGTQRKAEAEVRTLLAALPALKPFASTLLGAEVRKRFELDLDVTATYLLNASKAAAYKGSMSGDPFVTSDRAVKRATQSLLDCALQNFEAAEAQPGGLEAGGNPSLILDSNKVSIVGSPARQIAIVPEAFAAMVRDLDIGGQYQALVDAAIAGEAAQGALRRAEQATLSLQVHLAYLRGAIDDATHEVLTRLASLGHANYQDQPVLCSRITLLHATLTGAVAFGIAAAGPTASGKFPPLTFPYGGWVVLYLPGTPAPLTVHTSRQQAEAFLLEQLPAFRSAEALQLIPERDKSVFLSKLQDTLEPYTWNPAKGYQERIKDPNAWVSLHLQPFAQPLLDALASQRQQRLKDDAAFHAVSTAAEDEKTAAKRWAYFESLALNALNIGAFFIPGLAPLMLGLTVLQLGHEVFEGLADWADGEREQAFGYLMDVVENLALIGALGATTGAGAKPAIDKIPVETPSFIEELKPVESPSGDVRLWRRDLRPFAHDIVLPAGLKPDRFGLYHHQGKTWLPIEESTYAVSSTNAEHRLIHPARPHGYQPKLHHNGADTWLHELDEPQEWGGMQLFRRLGHLARGFDAQSASQILRVSCTDENVLRRILSENQRLPALLEDTLQRFALDRQVAQALPEAGISARNAEFEKRYRQLATSDAGIIQRVYPSLPTAIAHELLRNATASEQLSLAGGKVPLRIAEEIRHYQQQVRLARAYEGLYLGSVRSWDTDRLIAHSLEQLPGWPTDTRLELHQHSYWPSQHHSIGSVRARTIKAISSTEEGYIVHLATQAEATAKVHPNLYAALCEALPEAMASLGAGDEAGLRQQVQNAPLLPRNALRQVLGMLTVRPGFHSPMRLADGRLGYPLSGGHSAASGDVSRQALLDAATATGLTEHTRQTAEQVLRIVSSGRTRQQALEHLLLLGEQRNTLLDRLNDWSEAISPATDQAASDYHALREAILQHWYDSALEQGLGHAAELRIQRVPLADVPLILPDFFSARVHSLSLLDLPSGALAGWAQHERLLQRLLRQMPHIRSLEISRPYDPRATPSTFLFSILTITESLPALNRLILTNQNIALSEGDLNLLAGLGQLRHLDLSGNRLAQNNSPSFHELALDYLGLDQMQLSQWPIGIGSDALGRIGHLSLRNNNLRSLPAFLLNEAETLPGPPVISLQGNAINESHLQRLLLNERAETASISVDQSPELSGRLARMRNERQQMRDAIDGWAQASSSSNPLTQGALADRQRIETAISRFWERQERGLEHLWLQLEDVAIAHFPRRLPAFFGERVRAMTLTRLSGSAAELDALLRRFPNVTRLTIDAHQAATSSLASALVRLPQLTHLEFRNMGLDVDQGMLEIFARLDQLTSLDLSGNRVGTIAQAPARLSANLQSLGLTNMNLHSWPSWCDSLLPLELLDLSSNNLTELPEHILSNLNNPMPISSISLFDNPLPLDTILRVRTFSDSQHSYSFALDIPGDLMFVDSSSEGSLDHPHFPLLGDDTPRLEDWLLGSAAQNEALQDCWEQLEGSDLLRLTGRLHNAAPYVDPNTRAAFCERVRMMLVVAASNEAERPIMESIASAALPDPQTGSQTCHDGALQEFNNIELYLMGQRLLVEAGDTLQTLRRRLLQLFRIEQLELLANQRSGSGDLVSVRLAYRRELARELDLPIADSMRFRSAANLARDELSSVLEKVRTSELGSALIDYMLANNDWTARLRAEFAERFAEIETRFRLRVLELANADYPLQEELSLQQDLQREKDQEEQELLRDLTIAQVNSN
ncbi:dermonecrotic toxin domain-containing protein [Pseudomonas sp. NPDC089392]|uniref:dermonecrotic toxin domain-containing protein n=1 Tax=Pseudomonas sp. NPDC089392 TaxID=3364459 RepID=UPI00380A5043